MPRGVGMPNLRNISLPWYSWIFMLAAPPALTRQLPLGTTSDTTSHRFAGGVERVALVELERLAAVVALLAHLAGEGLDRRGREAAEHLGEVRAALHAAEQLLARSCGNPCIRFRPISRLYAGAMVSQPPG